MNGVKNENNVATLGRILAPDCNKKYQELFASWLYECIIPWDVQVSGSSMTETEIIQAVIKAVHESFEPFNGSTLGYASQDNEREMLYGVLWGKITAESLMNKDFLGTNPLCSASRREDGSISFSISLLPDGQTLAYSKRQREWCLLNAPDWAGKLFSEEEILKYMFPAWKQFGDFKSSLPTPPELDERERDFIRDSFPKLEESSVGDVGSPQKMSIEDKIKEYADKRFDDLQMAEIEVGLADRLDVSVYAKPEFNWKQMEQIRFGLEHDLDVSVYAKPEFTWEQMSKIYCGLEQDLDVSIYAKPELSWEQMEDICKRLKESAAKPQRMEL